MNVVVVIFCLQHKFLVSNKHGEHSSVLGEISVFLTLPFSIRVSPIISFKLLFLLKAIISFLGIFPVDFCLEDVPVFFNNNSWKFG